MTIVTLLGGAKVWVDLTIDRSRCRGCHKVIYWSSTENGRKMPICQDEKGEWISHFANCVKAKYFRKGRGYVSGEYEPKTNGIETINERRLPKI